MALINPAKLKTLVTAHANPMAPLNNPSAMAPDEDDEEDQGTEEDPEAAKAKGEELLAGWGTFGAALKDNADIVVQNATDVGDGLLAPEVAQDVSDKVADSVEHMPDEIQDGFADYIAKADPDDCKAIAYALIASAGSDADVELVCAYLATAGKHLGEIGADVPDDDADEDDMGTAPTVEVG